MTERHITLCQRVVRAHRHMAHISIEATRDEVLSVAKAIHDRSAGKDAIALSQKLERATGCDIFNLAKLAEEWPSL